MGKEKLLSGLILETPEGFRLTFSAHDKNETFDGATEEDCIRQAKEAYLKYYLGNSREQERVRQRVVWFNVDLPENIDATDAK